MFAFHDLPVFRALPVRNGKAPFSAHYWEPSPFLGKVRSLKEARFSALNFLNHFIPQSPRKSLS
jgi:hypothetical protein